MSEHPLNSFPQDIIGEKYQIQRQLASTRGNKTLLAKDIETGTLAVIKLFPFDHGFYRDDLQRLEREAETLKSLSHPSIPTYIDYFRVNTQEINGFALVQSYIKAPSLAAQIELGRSFTEVEIKQIATQILEILEYLHSHQPAVIHHNIKPSNILITNRSGNNVGKIYLVDFGRQNLIVSKNNTTAILKNHEYIPPEQSEHRVKPAFDLYSLRETLISLVLGKNGVHLSEIDLIVESTEFNNLSPGFKNWLKKIANPNLNSNVASAQKALQELGKCDYPEFNPVELFDRQPLKSKIRLDKNNKQLEIIIPSIGFLSLKTLATFISLLFCLIPWFIIFLQLSKEVSLEKVTNQPISILIAFMLCNLFAILIIAILSKGLFTKKVLTIDDRNMILVKKIFGIDYRNLFTSSRNNLSLVEKIVVTDRNNSKCYLNIVTDRQKCQLANDFHFPITPQEIDWLATEISTWLDLPSIENEINEYDFRQANLYSKKAHAYFLRGNYTEAIERYSLTLHFNPKSFKAYVNRAIINIYTQDYPSVIEDCCLALEINPNCAESYCVRGIAYYYLKDHHNALKNFQTAIEINPQYREAYYYLAATYIALENYPTAIQTCNQILEINPQYSRAYQMRANAYFALHDYQNTIEDCNYALQINSKFAEAYMVRGFAACYSGDLKQSLSDFTKQMKLEPTANGYYNLGSIQFILEKYSQAIDSFSSCLQVKPDFKFAYYARANIYYELNKREFALQDFQKATEIEAIVTDDKYRADEHSYYLRGLAKYSIDNNTEGAIQDLEKAREIAVKHQYNLLAEKAIAFKQSIRDRSFTIN